MKEKKKRGKEVNKKVEKTNLTQTTVSTEQQ